MWKTILLAGFMLCAISAFAADLEAENILGEPRGVDERNVTRPRVSLAADSGELRLVADCSGCLLAAEIGEWQGADGDVVSALDLSPTIFSGE